MSTDTFEAYFDIAQRLGFEFKCSEKNSRLVVTPNDPISNKKFFYLKKGDTAYYALDSYGAKGGSSTTFSGVYRALSAKGVKVESFISKRYWFDPLVGCFRVKTGNSYLDKHLSIETDNMEQTSKIIDMRIADQYLALLKAYMPIRLVIATDYLKFPASFRDMLVIGVERNIWVPAANFEQTYADFCVMLDEMQARW